ncbi:HalOD1 output domain-containing protein [Halomicrococcus sp. NG-SE-24]|uniref:HalOD1 output domain-containing protein n=1 Tax=Halomicrococcus sp. NG-SE-24 TaxID=3436928 RepID=UPI003D97E32E
MSSSTTGATAKQSTHHLHHEWNDEGWMSDQIVEAVAAYENEDQDELPPLSDSINPAALDTLFEGTDDDATMAGCVTFSYYGYTVLVQSSGQILLKRK